MIAIPLGSVCDGAPFRFVCVLSVVGAFCWSVESFCLVLKSWPRSPVGRCRWSVGWKWELLSSGAAFFWSSPPGCSCPAETRLRVASWSCLCRTRGAWREQRMSSRSWDDLLVPEGAEDVQIPGWTRAAYKAVVKPTLPGRCCAHLGVSGGLRG